LLLPLLIRLWNSSSAASARLLRKPGSSYEKGGSASSGIVRISRCSVWIGLGLLLLLLLPDDMIVSP
jgi:hypothetical protein